MTLKDIGLLQQGPSGIGPIGVGVGGITIVGISLYPTALDVPVFVLPHRAVLDLPAFALLHLVLGFVRVDSSRLSDNRAESLIRQNDLCISMYTTVVSFSDRVIILGGRAKA